MKLFPCGKVRAHLDACIDGQVSIDTFRLVVEHLEGCAECAREMANRQSLKEAVRRAVRGVAVPEGLEERVRRSIRRQASSNSFSSWRFRLTLVAATVIESITPSMT